MDTYQPRVPHLELCSRAMFGDLIITCQTKELQFFSLDNSIRNPKKMSCSKIKRDKCFSKEKRRVSALVDQLLQEIYGNNSTGTDYNSTTSAKSIKNFNLEELESKGISRIVKFSN